MGYSPWLDAAERHPDVQIARCDISPARGAWVEQERVILLDTALDVVGRRCALAHELAHVDLYHEPADGWFAGRFERDADRIAAGRLLSDVERIAEALAVHPLDPSAVAESLDVSVPVLRRRLRALTDAEKALIEARLERCDRSC